LSHVWHPRSYLEAQIIKALGGRVAKEIVFHGAGPDDAPDPSCTLVHGCSAPPHLAAHHGHTQRHAGKHSSQPPESCRQATADHDYDFHAFPASEHPARALGANASGKDYQADDQQT
jgi:hypothetical protein